MWMLEPGLQRRPEPLESGPSPSEESQANQGAHHGQFWTDELASRKLGGSSST